MNPPILKEITYAIGVDSYSVASITKVKATKAIFIRVISIVRNISSIWIATQTNCPSLEVARKISMPLMSLWIIL